MSPELVSRFQGITYGLWAKGCYTEARRGKEFYRERELLQSQWDFGIIGLVASRNVSVMCKWEIPYYKEDTSHNSAAKLWQVRNASLKKLSI